ncbi:MAG TPA: insulinase family protein, partial [Candidatus Ozemobacteraceae bacterium]|nr:insulinase family protein [Candidatus Ozemobacteraceae bacterium]
MRLHPRFAAGSARLLALMLGLVLLLCHSGDLAAEPDYKVFTLDNGLRVFIKELPSAPVVALNIWIQVGSRNEKAGQEGYAHLMEHMLFKGTPTHPTGALDREIKKLGASNNAF